MRALVTIVIGDDYQRRFANYCRENWMAYARHHGYELIIFDQPLDLSERAAARPIAWQKCLVLQHPAVARFQQVAWIDSDIVINEAMALPVFEGVDDDRIGAVDEFQSPDPMTYRRTLAAMYLRWRMQGISYLANLTPQQFYQNRGLPEHDAVVQTGVLVCSPEHHGSLLRHAYDAYEHDVRPGSLAEMAPVSHELLERKVVRWIDHRFNRQVLFGIEEHRLRHPTKVADPRGTAGVSAVRPIIASLLSDCHFLHFAGGQALMEHLQ